MATAVSPTSATPNHDLTLTDGSTTVGFVLVTGQGEKNERAIQEYPQQRTAIKLTSGDGQYSDYNLPYMSLEQSNWSSGRGNKRFEDDRAKFYNSFRANTQSDARILPGGVERYATGLRTWQGPQPQEGAEFMSLYDTTVYRAMKFTATASYTISQIQLWLDFIGNHNYLKVSIYSDVTNAPGVSLAYGTFYSFYGAEHTSNLIDISLAVTSGTAYWIVLHGDSGTLGETPSATRCAFVYNDTTAAGAALSSANGSTWASNNPFCYRLLDNSERYVPHFFEYKKALYMVKRFFSASDSTLYINGDRGAADSNVGDLTKLNDATKSWTVNEWAGAVVMIVGGPGVQETVPFRTITSNTATALTVDFTWKTTHTTATEYVITKTDVWKQITSPADLNGSCTRVAVAGEVVYFALGDSTAVLRYQEYNNGGTWTTRTASETLKATYLQYIRHPSRGGMLFAARISDSFIAGDYIPNSIYAMDVPDYWTPIDGTCNSGMFRLHKLTTCDKNWAAGSIPNVTQTLNSDGDLQLAVAAGYTTGVIAMQDFQAVDISDSNQIAFLIQSSVAATSGQLQLVLDDVITIGHNYGATAIWQQTGSTYTDLETMRDGDLATSETVTLASTDWLYVGCNEQFNIATLDVATANTNAATLTVQYYNGASWQSLTATDNTASSGKTFAQDGTITFTIPSDWTSFAVNNQAAYYIRMQTSAATSAMALNEFTVKRANNTTFNVPALAANEWTWCVFAYAPTGGTSPRAVNIQSVGLQLTADLGAMTVKMRDAVWAGKNVKYYPIGSDAKITNLAAYSADASGRLNPWIFTESGIYELQIDNDFQVIPLPIGEVSQYSDYRNGRVWALNDVYIYFNLKRKIERYYNRTLDDIGPDRDISTPGGVTSIVSYPGNIIASFDGNRTTQSNVMVLRNSGWHSMYESPYNATFEGSPSQVQILGMRHQPIIGSNMGRLWINEDTDVLWIPTSPDPENETEYKFGAKSVVITSRIYGGMQEMIKVFRSLKIVSNHLNTPSALVRVEYRTTDNYLGWVDLPTTFTTVPSQEVALTSSSPGGISAKWIEFRIRLYGVNRIDAWVLECYGVVPTKWAYSWTSIIREDYLSIDLQQAQELALGYSSRSETAYTQLKTWANAGTPLTMNSRASVYDGKAVILNPPASQPLRIDSLNQHEEILINLTALDL